MKIFPKIEESVAGWPGGFFILFGGYIAGFIVFASRQKMDLVRNDYYDQEIRYQQQIDRVQRTAAGAGHGSHRL